MDAAKFIIQFYRMCDFYSRCEGCPLYSLNNGTDISCNLYIKEYPNKAVEIVEKWSKQNPQKTILDDFKEKYPNAKLLNGYPMICPRFLGYKFSCDNRVCHSAMCCQKWDTPLNKLNSKNRMRRNKDERKIRKL